MRLLVCFVVGAVIGVGLDGIHVYGGVLSYPHTAIGRWAWYVPVQFGLIGLVLGLAMPKVEPLIAGGRRIRWTVEEQVGNLILLPSLYLTTTFVSSGRAAAWLGVALLGIAALRLILRPTPGDWIYVLVLGTCGPLGEALLSTGGLFSYVNPDFIHIPYWLPGLWANGALFARRLLYPIAMAGSPR